MLSSATASVSSRCVVVVIHSIPETAVACSTLRQKLHHSGGLYLVGMHSSANALWMLTRELFIPVTIPHAIPDYQGFMLPLCPQPAASFDCSAREINFLPSGGNHYQQVASFSEGPPLARNRNATSGKGWAASTSRADQSSMRHDSYAAPDHFCPQ